MIWVPVESKMLLSVAHDPTKHILYLPFRSADVYGHLPADKVLMVLRPRWGLTGVESALLPILAKSPLPEDRRKFVDGLATTQPATLTACSQRKSTCPPIRSFIAGLVPR